MALDAGIKLGRYEIRSKLGAGGMGEVYLAQDMELDRTVAIKILPERLAADPQRLQRFIQEAKAASALNHPHILTIHEIGNYQTSKFIAMEFIDGDTLGQRMRAGMKLLQVLEVASEVASALVAAHAAGIVHRDIKPDNVMVRRDGYVKVLDFGLAKLTERQSTPSEPEASTRALVNTDAGTVMGTANYMSPEQAKGVQVDARSDLWSLGAVIYEMVTGQLPFQGETPTETISLILQKEPPPLTRFVPDLPEELDRIVTKTLEKDREERYQTAKDLLLDLRHLKRKIEVDAEIDRTLTPEARAAATQTHDGPSTAAAGAATWLSSSRSPATASGSVHERRFSWRIPAVVVGAILLAIAALAVWNIARRKPSLTAKDTVLIADFTNTTSEPVFDGTLKQALAVQLGQSPYLNIYPEERVNTTLRFMGRAPNERITRDVAKEICEREGIKAMIVGSIAKLGSHYVLTLEAINAHEGDSIAREQSEAESKEQVLKALGVAASQLREKLGESLTSIKKFDAPIEQATTSSLEALKAFSQGTELRNQGKQVDSLSFYQHAIELDPNFALAYARLAVINSNLVQPELAAQNAQKAYDLRDRVSERERFYISEKYTSYVTGDREEAIRILQQWAQNYPQDYVPHNNLANNYALIGRHEDALKEAREAVNLYPTSQVNLTNYIGSFIRLNRFDEARETLEKYMPPDRPLYHLYNLQLAVIRHDKETEQKHLEWGLKQTNDPDILDGGAEIFSYYGQWRKAQELEHRAVELLVSQNRKETAAQFQAAMSFYAAQFGFCDQAKQAMTQSLSVARGRLNLGAITMASAACGDAAQAGTLSDELKKRFPQDTGNNYVVQPLTRALLELSRGNTTQAIEATQPMMRFENGLLPGVWLPYTRGQIFLKAKSGNEAATEFQKIIDHPGLEPFSPFNALAHLGLARASVLTGDTVKARREYQDFLAAWKDADSDLPILVEAKKEYERVK